MDEGDKFNLVITGHTWPFKDQMDKLGIRGGYETQDGTEKEGVKPAYFRVWKDIDASDKADLDKFESLLKDVFHNLAMRVFVDGKCSRGTALGDFLMALRQKPNLIFDESELSKEEDLSGDETVPWTQPQ